MEMPAFLMPKQKEVLYAVEKVRDERRVPTLEIEKALEILSRINRNLEDDSVSLSDSLTAALLAAAPGTRRVDIQERAAYRAIIESVLDLREIARLRKRH